MPKYSGPTVVMGMGVAVAQPAMPALVGYWLPKRLVLGTGVYTNGLLVGEIFPVALPLLLPTFADYWRATFALWAAPIVAIAVNKRPAVTAAMTPMRATRREPANDATANMTMGIPLSAPISVPVRPNSSRSAGICRRHRQDRETKRNTDQPKEGQRKRPSAR